MSNNIWFEVSRTNGAILSYYLEQPTSTSTTVDYVEATGEELIFLNALENEIFAPGTIATLSDLSAHRARVQAAKKAKAATPAMPVATAPQQPSKTSDNASTDPMVITNFKNGFKQVRK